MNTSDTLYRATGELATHGWSYELARWDSAMRISLDEAILRASTSHEDYSSALARLAATVASPTPWNEYCAVLTPDNLPACSSEVTRWACEHAHTPALIASLFAACDLIARNETWERAITLSLETFDHAY